MDSFQKQGWIGFLHSHVSLPEMLTLIVWPLWFLLNLEQYCSVQLDGYFIIFFWFGRPEYFWTRFSPAEMR